MISPEKAIEHLLKLAFRDDITGVFHRKRNIIAGFQREELDSPTGVGVAKSV